MWQSLAFSIKIVQLFSPHWKISMAESELPKFENSHFREKYFRHFREKYFHYFGKYSQRGLGASQLALLPLQPLNGCAVYSKHTWLKIVKLRMISQIENLCKPL